MEEGWSREAALACTAHPCELTVLGSRWSTNLTRPETSAEVPHQSWKKNNNNQDWALSLASLWWDVTGWRRGTRPPNQQHAELTVEWLCCFLIPRAFQSEMFWASKPVLTTLQIKRCQCCCHCFFAMAAWATFDMNYVCKHNCYIITTSMDASWACWVFLVEFFFFYKFSHVSVVQSKYHLICR